MNERDYAHIAAACDRLLRSAGSGLGRVAVPLLHVINEHPALLRQYEPLFAPAAVAGVAAAPPAVRTATVLRRAARALRRTSEPPPPQQQSPDAPRHVDVLIVSRANAPAQLDGPDDFYFGALPRLLGERGATSLVALVNHLPRDSSPAFAQGLPLSPARLLLPRTLPVSQEVPLWARSLLAGRALRTAARVARDPLESALASLAAREVLAGAAMQNLRLHGCLLALCRRLRPRVVVTTYEGDASERLIWHAARAAGGQPLCVGYQHTPVREHAHAIRRRVGAPGIDCDPDVILTLGEISEALLAASEALRPVRLITYGSHRRAAPGATVPGARERPVCLVLPDADPRECDILFRFAVECAVRLPATTFLLRPHPASGFDVSALTALAGELPRNVALAREQSLQQLCSQARYCLYRGSSAVLQAVLAGVRPFYLARPGELRFDPLYQLDGWRETVTTPEEFRQRSAATDASPDPQGARRAHVFCERYLSPVRAEAVDTLLSIAATAGPAQGTDAARPGVA